MSIDYSLAAKLKAAGFPQNHPIEAKKIVEDFAIPYEPTLSELGDALPDGFYSGRYKQIGAGTGTAEGALRYFAAYDPTPFEGTPIPEIRESGTTEEEARAKLWLALHSQS